MWFLEEYLPAESSLSLRLQIPWSTYKAFRKFEMLFSCLRNTRLFAEGCG